MAFSLNRIMLIGNLGKDAETRVTTTGKSVTTFSMVTEHSYKSGDEWKKESTWHNVQAWELSDYYKEALRKGKKFYVEGRLAKREYTDKEGIKRYSVDVMAEKIIPLSPKQDDTAPADTYTVENSEIQEESDGLPF
jgi:single-strand DNA-binding protein